MTLMTITCAWENCNESRSGKSKYCLTHKREARRIWKQNRQAEQAERDARYKSFKRLTQEAHKAGMERAEACKPTPMVVQTHENMLDDDSPVIKQEIVQGGVCGFAWVHIVDGRSSFARWAKKQGIASKAYNGGLNIYADAGGQSYEINRAYAGAYASVLANAGIQAYAEGRLD